jgi:hypothetical protein
VTSERLTAHQKALRINVDATVHGTFAEIGAGQEVVRWFFHVGGAASTVAKTISAYDMQVSDAIYGSAKRYVSKQRLQAMLDYEYDLLVQRLAGVRGERSAFFAFADTVATSSYSRHEDGHGWVGLKFQHRPMHPPSQITLHARLLDSDNVRQQEAIGTLGVNLLYAAYHLHGDPHMLVSSLGDELSRERLEIDMVDLRSVLRGARPPADEPSARRTGPHRRRHVHRRGRGGRARGAASRKAGAGRARELPSRHEHDPGHA